MHILTNKIGLGQFNELHNVFLLDVTQYKNCRVLEMYMHFPYRNSKAQGVMVEDDALGQKAVNAGSYRKSLSS